MVRSKMLTATDWADVDAGDRFVIETPGRRRISAGRDA